MDKSKFAALRFLPSAVAAICLMFLLVPQTALAAEEDEASEKKVVAIKVEDGKVIELEGLESLANIPELAQLLSEDVLKDLDLDIEIDREEIGARVGKALAGLKHRAHRRHKPRGVELTVTGNGEVRRAPDIAKVNFLVSKQHAKSDFALNNLQKSSDRVLKALRELNIKGTDIKTFGHRLHQSYEPEGCQYERRRKKVDCKAVFVAEQNVKVSFSDISVLSVIGQVIQTAIKAGATELAGIQFSRSDAAALQTLALRRAVADAQHKAKAIASELGLEKPRIVAIEEANYYPSGGGIQHRAMAADYASSGVEVEPEDLGFSARITADILIPSSRQGKKKKQLRVMKKSR